MKQFIKMEILLYKTSDYNGSNDPLKRIKNWYALFSISNLQRRSSLLIYKYIFLPFVGRFKHPICIEAD